MKHSDEELFKAINILNDHCESTIDCSKCSFGKKFEKVTDCWLYTTPSHYPMNILRSKMNKKD